MAVFNNRFYPDQNLVTWANIAAVTWGNADVNWVSANSSLPTYSQAWTSNTDVTDLGSIKSFYPVTSVEWDDTYPVTITYEVSLDGTTFTEYSAGPLTGRYLKTKINTQGQYLSSISTEIQTAPIIETYYNINSADLPGNVTHRRLSTNSFSQIQSVTITSAVTESRPIGGQIVENTTGNVIIRAIDLDSWGKVATNANVNIVVVGFPRLIVNANIGYVYPAL